MCRSISLLVLMVLLVVPSCGTDPVDPVELTAEEVVIANARMVRDAAEAYAAEHDGEYPLLFGWDQATFFADLLPNGERLTNPYTLLRTNPEHGYAIAPGQIGYQLTQQDADDPPGYVINGVGQSGNLVVLSKNYPDSISAIHMPIIANAQLVYQAAEAFASENNGEYPYNTEPYDTTLAGRALLDFLPGGERLVNPVTGARTEPCDRVATSGGEVGYVPIQDSDSAVGFTITAFGRFALIATCCGGAPEHCYWWLYE